MHAVEDEPVGVVEREVSGCGQLRQLGISQECVEIRGIGKPPDMDLRPLDGAAD